MRFVHGRIAQLAMVTESNLVYFFQCILMVFEKSPIFQSAESSLFKGRLR